MAIIVSHKLLIVTDGDACDLLVVALLEHFDELKGYPSLFHDTQEWAGAARKRDKRNGREGGRVSEKKREDGYKMEIMTYLIRSYRLK